ncbi:MAG TPA: S1 RNA-binding domain-containing protein [Bellilinea sp.]|nr:S1 RNA-binding domain-containing protein [Bellilinea sp.]
MDQNDAQLEQGAAPENEQVENFSTLLEQEDSSIDFPKQGEIRTGMIASISPGQILVSVGTKSEGIISGREYEAIPAEELVELQVGQEVPVYVINPEDSSGNVVLSYVRAREEMSWKDADTLMDSKENFHSKIIGYNKGGLIVPVGGLRGFVPASQVSLSRRAAMSGDTPEARWSKMIGEEIDVCVIEVDRERRRLILSERQASTETRESIKERVIDELTEGEIRSGRVTSLAEFGAFVNISGADGLVHLSEISWDRIQHPSEVLKVGQDVKVKVISIDRDKKRIGLSIRQLLEDPWGHKAAKYQVGQLIEGTITRLTKFGAFARIEDDIEGLIHISEIHDKRIEHPKEVLKEGDVVTLRVIKVDPDNHRIGLSLRRVESMAYADMDWESLEGVLEESEPAALEEKPAVAEEKPAAVEKPARKKKPAAEEIPAVDETPVVEDNPVAEEIPASDEETK